MLLTTCTQVPFNAPACHHSGMDHACTIEDLSMFLSIPLKPLYVKHIQFLLSCECIYNAFSKHFKESLQFQQFFYFIFRGQVLLRYMDSCKWINMSLGGKKSRLH
jgi:hypothetical protein